MDTATTAPFTVRVADSAVRPHVPHGEASDLEAALRAAWVLQRHTESTVEVVDNRDGEPRVVARLTLEWLDGE